MKDLTGMKFGMLTVVQLHHFDGKWKNHKWLCKCDCGGSAIVQVGNLRSRPNGSCGCRKKKITREINLTHGASQTSLYKVWLNIKQRCFNPKCKGYKYYGKRGITMCQEWANSFESFADYMGSLKGEGEIDRINNNGNYEPGNVRWATRIEQMRNRACSMKLTWNDKTQSVVEWAEELMITPQSIRNRIYKNWPVNQILTQPLKLYQKRK